MRISCWQLVNGNETDIARLFFDALDVATILYWTANGYSIYNNK